MRGDFYGCAEDDDVARPDGMEGGRHGAGIQIWTMDCMSNARGGTNKNRSLDQLSTALHLPIYDSKMEGTMEDEKPHDNPVEPG